MNYTREEQIDDAFFALSHPVRRKIIERLSVKDMSVAELAKPLGETPSQMTKHLQILERGGMLSREKEGRSHRLHMETGSLQDVMNWVSYYQKFWDTRFDALEDYLHNLSEEK